MVKKIILFSLIFVSCHTKNHNPNAFIKTTEINNDSPLILETLGFSNTGIRFQNQIKETVRDNYLNFMHIYLGAGVAAADFNNDGLQDIYFVSNFGQDKLYLNKGNLKFDDISAGAKITKTEGTFSTGVTIVDINHDGFADIYLCRSGSAEAGNAVLTNQLYINNGDLTFTEKAKEFGLDEKSHSTQALFFDYDLDGDLDLYLVNTPIDFEYTTRVYSREGVSKNPKVLSFGSSDKLFKNDNGKFKDVSAESGMIAELSFGLNAIICDINNDNYPDIHVSNDFVGPDFLYENQKDGTFKEVAIERLKHTSFYSMGSDVSDINNDGNFDLFVVDMSFKDYKKSKTSMSMSNRDQFRTLIKYNYNYQYMQNMLHLGNGEGGFSEVSQLAGIDKTDWSWSSLFVDFDHDGLKDVYITNGIVRNIIDKDGSKKLAAELKKFKASGEKISQEKIEALMNIFPEAKMTNYIFKNKDGIKFELKNNKWKSEKPGITQGACYADFDNDGDLDIIMNNTNAPASLLKNLASEKRLANSIIIELNNSKTKNYFGIGAIVELETNGIIQKQFIMANRGYFSASQSLAHFGIGNTNTIERITITWPNGKIQTLKDIKANQKLNIAYEPDNNMVSKIKKNTLFKNLSRQLSKTFIHYDEYSDDYDTQVLIPHRLSSYGPKLITGDLNNNGLKDVYIPGGFQQEGSAYFQKENGFELQKIMGFDNKEKEETCGSIGDFNNDGYNDIYVGCGSYQFNKTSEVTDYMLFGTADNVFTNASENIPVINSNTSKVLPFDYDQDGDLDLFIGSRVVSGSYPLSPKNYILQNNQGQFTDVTHTVAPELEFFGMVTDADWKLKDNNIMLVVVGEWTGIGLFEYDGTKFNGISNNISSKFGWWNAVKFEDLDNDGDQDIVAGNLGLNYKFHASEEKPFQLFYGDLNNNGNQEIILAKETEGLLLPVRGKECSTEQMPIISEKFPSFTEFANQDLFGIYGESLKNANKYSATMFETAIFINNDEVYETRILPHEAQFSTVNGIVATDVNKDGHIDLILAGNMYESEIETTKADASKGIVLINDGNANFTPLSIKYSGFLAEHNVKSIQLIEAKRQNYLFVGNNNEAIQLYSINK